MKSRTLKCGCIWQFNDLPSSVLCEKHSEKISPNEYKNCRDYEIDELYLMARTDISEERILKLRVLK